MTGIAFGSDVSLIKDDAVGRALASKDHLNQAKRCRQASHGAKRSAKTGGTTHMGPLEACKAGEDFDIRELANRRSLAAGAPGQARARRREVATLFVEEELYPP